jgi:hypothetical protein
MFFIEFKSELLVHLKVRINVQGHEKVRIRASSI